MYLLICLEMVFHHPPNNSTQNQSGSKFPTLTLWDNIYCQHKLVTEKLNIKKDSTCYRLVNGWLSGLSMGSTISEYG